MSRDPLPFERPLGATPLGGGRTRVRVWAPRAGRVEVEAGGARTALAPEGHGTFCGEVAAGPGDDYRIALDGGAALPDPCSRHQPEGVRGPSRIVDPAALAPDHGAWAGLDRDALVIYEIHVGAFSPAGTFAGVAERLPELRELGVTAIELMPVATFPGARNWGYDGLYTWAPHPAYGGPEGLAALVGAAHRAGIGVILDVVYNHLGPGSEALEAFGPYLTDGHGTPWGRAINVDDCGGVREWALQNAEMWVRDHGIDGLRVDAVHAIEDRGARHVLAELTARVRAASGGRALTIAESDLNDPRVLRGEAEGGWGFDAQWADDPHHALHALLSGEGDGYYADFGSLEDVERAARSPFVYDGRWSGVRARRHGAPAGDLGRRRFVTYVQNHDQVGNRAVGDRPASSTRALSALWTLLSPYTPMLFMGEEYGESRPFAFFTDHIDPSIADAAREGRRHEFRGFTGFDGELPDPQAPATFAGSVLDPAGGDPALRALYRRLIALRADLGADPPAVRRDDDAGWIAMRRGALEVVGNMSRAPAAVPVDAREVVVATDPAVALERGALRLPPLAGAAVR